LSALRRDGDRAADKSALLDLVRSGVELAGPQKHPTAEVARLAFHLERIAAELAATRETLAYARGELGASERTEKSLQKYVDRFEEKAAFRIKSLEVKVEEMTNRFHAANLQIAELKNALQISQMKNKQLEERLQRQSPVVPKTGIISRIFYPHAQA